MVFQLPVVVGGKGEKGLSLLLVNQKCLPYLYLMSKEICQAMVSKCIFKLMEEDSTLWFYFHRNLLQVKEDSVMIFPLLEQNCLNSIHLATSKTRQELLFIFPPVHLVSSAGL